MDETLTRVAVDVSGRPYLVWKVTFPTEKLGAMDTELFREWFHAFAHNAGLPCMWNVFTEETRTI